MSGFDYDENGEMGKTGRTNPELLKVLLNDDYILRDHPKSIDNSWIKEQWIPKMLLFNLSTEDYLRTHYQFIAQLIANICDRKNSKILFSGGGAKNKFLFQILENELKNNQEIVIPDQEIIAFKECILMAYMAYKRIKEECNFISSATGARHDSCGGAVHIYKNE